MKKMIVLMLAGLMTLSANAQMARPVEIPVAPGMFKYQNKPDPDGVQQCKLAHDTLKNYIERLNTMVFNMQNDRNSAYYVTYDVWRDIRVLLMKHTEPMLTSIERNSYRGLGGACTENANAGMVVARDIVEQNLKHRKVN